MSEKIIKVCPHCKEGSLKTKDAGLSTEYKYCTHCKVELFLDECDEKVEKTMRFVNENGRAIYYKENVNSKEKRRESLKRTMMARRKGEFPVLAVSRRDQALLRKLRKGRK